MSVREDRQKETKEASPAFGASDPSVAAEYLSFPGAKWIVRSRLLSPSAFAWVSGRIRRGLRFGVAARIEDSRHRILLVRMNPETAWTVNWTTPGGGAEPGETPRHAILREIDEETGVRTHALRLWKVYHESLRSPTGRTVEWDFLQYTARWTSGVPRSRVPSEIVEVRWFSRLPQNTEFRTDWLCHVRRDLRSLRQGRAPRVVGRRRQGPGTAPASRTPLLELENDYHGIIVEESLRDRSLLDAVRVLGRRQGRDWGLLRVGVEAKRLPNVIQRLQRTLKVENGVPFYAHFYRPGELIVVFPDRLFRLTPQRDTWGPAVAYGRSVGVPLAQLDFEPHRVEDEDY